jgi:hypothetical protein
MTSLRDGEAQQHMRIHRLAVELYEWLAARHGIYHRQVQLALRLVEATNAEGSAIAVPCVGLVPEEPQPPMPVRTRPEVQAKNAATRANENATTRADTR